MPVRIKRSKQKVSLKTKCSDALQNFKCFTIVCASWFIVSFFSSHQLRIFVNQLHRNGGLESHRDLLAIRMASVNPILDPWIYILLRKTVVLKLMEKIKCLFCKMGGRGRGSGGQFHCADAHLSSIVSRDCHSLASRELQDMVSTSQTFLYPSEGNPERSSQAGSQCDSGPQADQTPQEGPQEDAGPQAGFSQGDLEDTSRGRTLSELPMCPKDSTLYVTLTEKTAKTQEKCI